MLHRNYPLKDFFWNHLNNDIKMIQKSLNLNVDEAYVILHVVMKNIFDAKPSNLKLAKQKLGFFLNEKNVYSTFQK